MSYLLSIVMPAYNEQDCIEKVVYNWTSFLKTKFPNDNTTLIVINDGSKDNTKVLLDELDKKIDNLTVVHQKNGGHGNAVVNGYRKALEVGSEYVFQTDSDDQFVSEDFDKLWDKRSQSQFILGYRQVRHDAGVRLFITKFLRGTISAVYGTFIMDSNIPFRLIKGTFLQKLMNQLPNPEPFAPNIFLAVMAKKSGQQLFDIPITHKDRETGTVSIVKWNLWKVCIRSFKELLRFRLELNDKVKAIRA
ncbi:glycosyltransferase involved in cell wall biosynthesis [Dyadobacter sp. BE34]|uniref:Glycosyltransferase involved in cell wall biosynthesis n=1 Tax=Dyadobacter fermentans TaxID=94254 RepID=A0ABU1QSG5_9BACT|nr:MULTISPECIES: glycosyltransferase family 2 protein [Dyadobacter]HWV30557.1 glycosyltransferase family 2 protein [Dyadobacter sp.]MBZ1362858.1 glycosyltransferase family 2 protein [Dyadobacter fermentans]MDR6804105.1 glycosyltransferase involved in cell wall biosynthesis [Dyadobacter fermentans]MDR7041845.1 glycosyltransferase involved in cell wall biosynthesis [Dyadobacter sp. BE242]MDR7196248.1 glycosyltransferase involved in cell wall biosynthesis [Dyadobacter sp. BE34]